MSSELSSKFPLKYENEEPVSDSHQKHSNNVFSVHLHTDTSVPSDSLTEVKIKSEVFECDDGLNEYSCDYDPLGTEIVPIKSSEEVDILENISVKPEVIEDDNFHTIQTEQKNLFCSESEKCSQVTNFVSQGKKFTNSECRKSFNLKDTLEKQNKRLDEIRLRATWKQFACRKCGKFFPTIRLLHRHRFGHNNEKCLPSRECGQSLSLNETLLKSYRRHRVVRRQFTCRKCGESFSEQYSLIEHNRVHLQMHQLYPSKKPFVCTDCGKPCYSKASLKAHMKIHGVGKSYQCNECEKTFYLKAALTNHMWTHTERKMSPLKTSKPSYKHLANSRWNRGEKWVLLWALEYARVKYPNRNEQGKVYQKIFQHHCPNKKHVPRGQLASRKHSIALQKVFTEEEITSMKNAVKAMIENQKCPLSEPLEVPASITTLQTQNLPPNDHLRPSSSGVSVEAEGSISPQRLKAGHPVNSKWEIEEKWVLLWAFEYARVKYTSRTEQSKEWYKIFQHHCPNKKGIPKNVVTSQRNNSHTRKLFTEEEITYMKNKVKAIIENQKCPFSEPLELPTNITTPLIQRKRDNMPPHEQLRPIPRGIIMEAEDKISSQRWKTEPISPEPSDSPALSSSLDSEEPDSFEMPQRRRNPFQSNDYGKSFSDKSALTKHTKTHSGGLSLLPISCHECGKTFALKQDIVSHMRIHTNEKPFFCQICQKAFAYKSLYAIHMRIHS